MLSAWVSVIFVTGHWTHHQSVSSLPSPVGHHQSRDRQENLLLLFFSHRLQSHHFILSLSCRFPLIPSFFSPPVSDGRNNVLVQFAYHQSSELLCSFCSCSHENETTFLVTTTRFHSSAGEAFTSRKEAHSSLKMKYPEAVMRSGAIWDGSVFRVSEAGAWSLMGSFWYEGCLEWQNYCVGKGQFVKMTDEEEDEDGVRTVIKSPLIGSSVRDVTGCHHILQVWD